MGIEDRKARERQELREKILTAAEELFAHEGYGNVSMRKIADRIEYSPTTIYRMFENKAEIMHHLITEGYGRVYEVYDGVLRDPPGSPWEELKALIGAYVTFCLENPNHYELWFATGHLEESAGRLWMQHGADRFSIYHLWLERIEACIASGCFPGKDTMNAFQMVWCAVHGTISLRIQHPGFAWMEAEEQIGEVLRLLAGVSAGGEAAPAAAGAP